MGLRSLKTIYSGGVAILENKNLCFSQGIQWDKIKKSAEHQDYLYNNKAKGECGKSSLHWSNNLLLNQEKNNNNFDFIERENLVCDPQCSEEGCWGPGPDQCLSCANYIFNNTCIQDCDAISGYEYKLNYIITK